MNGTKKFDVGQCEKALRSLLKEGQRYEARIIAPTGIYSGVYDDIGAMVRDVDRLAADLPDGAGYYYTPNPVKTEPYALRKGNAVKDADILKRDFLLIDVDPERGVKGTCATDQEKTQGVRKAFEVMDYLRAREFVDPVIVDSGNGIHLYYKTDLPADSDVPARLLADLARRFNGDGVKIDTAISNAARILRLPGSLNAKGENTRDRPHRPVTVVSYGSGETPASVMAAALPAKLDPVAFQPEPAKGTGFAALNDIDMQRFASLLPDCDTRPVPWDGGVKYTFRKCPMGPHDGGNHSGEAFIGVNGEGTRIFHCSHDGHTGIGWDEFTRTFQAAYDASVTPRHTDVQINLTPKAGVPDGTSGAALSDALMLRSGGALWVTLDERDAQALNDEGYSAVSVDAEEFTGAFSDMKAKGVKYDRRKIVLAFGGDIKTLETVKAELSGTVDCMVTFDAYYGHGSVSSALEDVSLVSGELLGEGKTVQDAVLDAMERVETCPHIASVGTDISRYLEQFSADVEQTPTGFPQLDFLLEGGMEPGLYVLGGVSSTGKTTFAMQIMDDIARHGRQVLIFSAEMRAADLVARSISRETRHVTAFPLTQSQVQSKRKRVTDDNKASYERAVACYRQYAGNIHIVENPGKMSPSDIAGAIDKYIRYSGSKPVVFVDYLQILSPDNARADMRQATDEAVAMLKACLNRNGIPMLVISALNRDNYTAEINLASFKESGAIEYSADVLLGLQFSQDELNKYKDIPNKDDRNDGIRAIAKAKMPPVRNVELVLLKQRKGKSSGVVRFRYDAPHNSFGESDTPYKFILDNYGGGDESFMDRDTQKAFEAARDEWNRQHPDTRALGLSDAERSSIEARRAAAAEKQSAAEKKAKEAVELQKSIVSNIGNVLQQHGPMTLADLVTAVYGYIITAHRSMIKATAVRMVQEGTLKMDGKRVMWGGTK